MPFLLWILNKIFLLLKLIKPQLHKQIKQLPPNKPAKIRFLLLNLPSNKPAKMMFLLLNLPSNKPPKIQLITQQVNPNKLEINPKACPPLLHHKHHKYKKYTMKQFYRVMIIQISKRNSLLLFNSEILVSFNNQPIKMNKNK